MERVCVCVFSPAAWLLELFCHAARTLVHLREKKTNKKYYRFGSALKRKKRYPRRCDILFLFQSKYGLRGCRWDKGITRVYKPNHTSVSSVPGADVALYESRFYRRAFNVVTFLAPLFFGRFLFLHLALCKRLRAKKILSAPPSPLSPPPEVQKCYKIPFSWHHHPCISRLFWWPLWWLKSVGCLFAEMAKNACQCKRPLPCLIPLARENANYIFGLIFLATKWPGLHDFAIALKCKCKCPLKISGHRATPSSPTTATQTSRYHEGLGHEARPARSKNVPRNMSSLPCRKTVWHRADDAICKEKIVHYFFTIFLVQRNHF